MSPNLLRALFLIALVVGAIYIFSGDGPIANQGVVNLDQVGNNVYVNANGNGYANNGTGNRNALGTTNTDASIINSTNSTYNTSSNLNSTAARVNNINTNANVNANVNAALLANANAQLRADALLNRNVNPQVDDELNSVPLADVAVPPVKRVQFLDPAVNGDGLNTVKLNKAVLAYPQLSNNYTTLNGRVTGYAGNSLYSNAQTVDQIASRCNSGLSCYPRDTVTAQELLPRDDPYNMWEQVNPATPGHLADKNFLESGHHYGINTVGSSLRNANLQLRADPPIANIPVSIWNQSTIDPDTNQRAFEIGSAY